LATAVKQLHAGRWLKSRRGELTVPHQRDEEAPTGIEPVYEALQASA
jgi:hypothetical protein